MLLVLEIIQLILGEDIDFCRFCITVLENFFAIRNSEDRA